MQLKVDLCQISSIVGDLAGNANKILTIYQKSSADLVVFPELSLTGYHCKDLFLSENFLQEVQYYTQKVVQAVNNKALIIGVPIKQNNLLFNSALFIQNYTIQDIYYKYFLPNYDVFDEHRYFNSGPFLSKIFILNNINIRILICEDVWQSGNLYQNDINAEIVIVINASPYYINKQYDRIYALQTFSRKHAIKSVLYLNAFGAHDHLVFDGGSFILYDNHLVDKPIMWQEDIIQYNNNFIEKKLLLSYENHNTTKDIMYFNDDVANDIYHAILLALQQYSIYSKFNKFIIGLSGGIDSALVATLAVDAFGADNVLCVAMPSKYSSQSSINDAQDLASKLKCELSIIPIHDIKNIFDQSLYQLLGNLNDDCITNENLQPRIRSVILMAIANKQNRLLLCTSNKSENAVGYTTLYGDMSGAYAPIIDLYKTQVYSLSKWHTKVYKIISTNILTKVPSAELKPNQKDTDTLPVYDILDDILYSIIEKKQSLKNIDMQLIHQIANLLYKNEFKRFQGCLGPKINRISLNYDRRYPICIQQNTK